MTVPMAFSEAACLTHQCTVIALRPRQLREGFDSLPFKHS